MHIITISREFGSGGRELGKRLAEALGYAYYDREILTMLAERTDLDEAYLAHTLEESAPSALFPITIGQTFSVLPNYQAEYSTQLLQKQTALIKELATKSDCVIVGRNADIILREQDPLRLFVHADMEARIARCRRREVSGEDFTDKEYEKKDPPGGQKPRKNPRDPRHVRLGRPPRLRSLHQHDACNGAGYHSGAGGLRQNLGGPPRINDKIQTPQDLRGLDFLCACAMLSYMITWV